MTAIKKVYPEVDPIDSENMDMILWTGQPDILQIERIFARYTSCEFL